MRSPWRKSGGGILPGCPVALGMSTFQAPHPAPRWLLRSQRPRPRPRCVGLRPRMKLEMWVAKRSAAHEGRKGAWRSEEVRQVFDPFQEDGPVMGQGRVKGGGTAQRERTQWPASKAPHPWGTAD